MSDRKLSDADVDAIGGSVASVVGNVGGTISTSQVITQVTGAVGSVTGAVGSVTGNVGGNVVGSVASVVGNVGGTVSTSQIISTVNNPVTVGTINASAAKYKKNVALSNFGFIMQNSTTGAVQTGLTVASVFALDGGSFSSTSNSVVEVGLGWYRISLIAAEMNGTFVKLQFTAASAITNNVELATQP